MRVLDLDESGEPDMEQVAEAEEQITGLVMSLVKDWDYTDVDTGEPIPVGEPDELSDEQYNEVMEGFNGAMEKTQVPKVNAAPSSSGRTPSKAKRNRAKRRTG